MGVRLEAIGAHDSVEVSEFIVIEGCSLIVTDERQTGIGIIPWLLAHIRQQRGVEGVGVFVAQMQAQIDAVGGVDIDDQRQQHPYEEHILG